MTLSRCRECSTLFAVGLFRCPLCKSTEHDEEGNEAAMPKISLSKGPTNAAAEEGEPGWDGNSSSASEPETEPSESTSAADDSSTAPTTDGRSKKGRTASSSARSTGGAKTKQ